MSTDVQELAGKAADEIRRRGWMQGYYYPRQIDDIEDALTRAEALRDCPVCVLGAIYAAHYGNPRDFGCVSAPSSVWSLIDEICARSLGLNAYAWNDHPKRTKEQVLAMLDGIANRDAA